jgi:hypothetical protein
VLENARATPGPMRSSLLRLGRCVGKPGCRESRACLLPGVHVRANRELHHSGADTRRSGAPDTTNRLGGTSGSSGARQLAWLAEQLVAVHSRWYGAGGRLQRGRAGDRLV